MASRRLVRPSTAQRDDDRSGPLRCGGSGRAITLENKRDIMTLHHYIQKTIVKWTQNRHPIAFDLAERYEQATGLRLYTYDDINDEANALSRTWDDPDEAEEAFWRMVKAPLPGNGPWFIHPWDLRAAMLSMVLDYDLQTLAFMRLIEKRGDEWSLTEIGCDVAAGRHIRGTR
jgi:hypothetical protein